MKNKILNTFILILFLLISCKKNHLQKPNIIYILADDLGYGDIKAFNIDGKIIKIEIWKNGKMVKRIYEINMENISFIIN